MARGLFSRAIEEARISPTVGPPPRYTAAQLARSGFVSGIPVGGATDENPAQSTISGALTRAEWMDQLWQAYMACPWASACVDVTARTITAGGIQCVPISLNLEKEEIPPQPELVQKVQRLLEWVNPQDDIRQLMRNVVADLLIFGDSYTEVVYLMGEPIALYHLDPRTMQINSDDHGNITGYTQTMGDIGEGQTATFKPHEVIHVKFDAPGGGLYGVSPTQKLYTPITIWLFTAGLVQQAMRKGDPSRLHVDWPIALPQAEMKKLQQQFQIRNLGSRNVGNLFETKGGAVVRELGQNNMMNWFNVMNQRRDEIISGYGLYPSKVGIIEAGNIGGGTGTSQERGFQINTCGPLGELILEKFTFRLLTLAYKVTDWRLDWNPTDYRSDMDLEQILDMRLRNGLFVLNKARATIGEPPVDGGDEAVLVDRQNIVLYSDLHSLSKANVAAVQAKGSVAGSGGGPSQAPAAPGSPQPGDGTEDDDSLYINGQYRNSYLGRKAEEEQEFGTPGGFIEDQWRIAYRIRRQQMLEELRRSIRRPEEIAQDDDGRHERIMKDDDGIPTPS